MTETADIVAIAQVIQAWGLWRDQGRWAELAGTFAEEGRISVTWFSGGHDAFIERCKATHKAQSPRSKHQIGLPVVRVDGDRAVCETNVQILGRATIAGVAVDNTSYARFFDRLVRAPDGWRIAERVAIYEKDRFDPVVPSDAFDRWMADTDFSDIPEPYRFLGYRLRESGRSLVDPIVVDGSDAALRLQEDGAAWLAGG